MGGCLHAQDLLHAVGDDPCSLLVHVAACWEPVNADRGPLSPCVTSSMHSRHRKPNQILKSVAPFPPRKLLKQRLLSSSCRPMAACMCSRVWLDCFLRPAIHRAVQKPACQGGSHTFIYCPASAQHVLREAHYGIFTSKTVLASEQDWPDMQVELLCIATRLRRSGS